jgi:pimeloyl-ACP methyl ester carboxylesterase
VSARSPILAPSIVATRDDLPAPVRAALDDPDAAVLGWVDANGLRYATRRWGNPGLPPLLIVHGVTSSSRTFWRLGPALAAGLDRHVVALDQAGHGQTRAWLGHHRFRDNAADLVAFVAAAGLDRPDLRVLGHSWGAMTVAWLPSVGVATEAIVLLDPPAVSAAEIATMLDDPIERHYDDLDEAIAAIGALNPTWPHGDVLAKAESLTQFDLEAVRDILTRNGDWDGGLAALADPAAANATVRLVRGEPAAGGLIPEPAAEALAARLGRAQVTTIAGGSHSPQRQRPEATTLALLRALAPG